MNDSNTSQLIILPDLPYALDALEPYLSRETLEYHYGKHHATYVKNLNGLIASTEFASMPLQDIIKQSSGTMFNNAAQIWNHNFYWQCLTPHANHPSAQLIALIDSKWGSLDLFKQAFAASCAAAFGSAWVWLVQRKSELEIVVTFNAGCVLTANENPLLVCDVWEHAYYIDYRNSRPQYLENFWQIVNWEFVSQQLI